MGELIVGQIKELLSIKIKPRLDSMLDQYSRIGMVKVLLACTITITIAGYLETVNCIIPDDLGLCTDDDKCLFPKSTCWIQGMYVYKELMDKVENNVAYYGMPKNIDQDGMTNGTDELCVMEPKLGVKPSKSCVPMEKTFYLQYQWMAYLLGALSLVHYLPYVGFYNVNGDLFALKRRIKAIINSEEDIKSEVELIVRDFFRRRNRDRTSRQRTAALLRPFLNIVVKILYLGANIISLLFLDYLLNGEYLAYGVKWIQWSNLKNTVMYDYMGLRSFPKPGNRLLPPFGYCELYESSRDIRHTIANKHKMVCEMSHHILLQYCLLLVWFGLVIGIGVAFVALIHVVWTYIRCKSSRRHLKSLTLTVREIDYMEYMKMKDPVIYGEVLKELSN